jgi:hypothetical protein
MKEKMAFDAGLKIGLLKHVYDEAVPEQLKNGGRK